MMAAAQFDKRIEAGEVQLAAGDWLIQYTDGINEARGADDQEYGMDRLKAVISRSTTLSAGELTGVVLNDIASFVSDSPQYDDMTLLALRWTGGNIEANNRILQEVTNAARG
jgi:sigma-B regulation protein RsbU (phosphoserine phosphatase)